MVFQHIGVIGLIGGSIAKKLQQKGYPIYTVKAKSLLTAVLPTLAALAKYDDSGLFFRLIALGHCASIDCTEVGPIFVSCKF